jgi:hypothetical protein
MHLVQILLPLFDNDGRAILAEEVVVRALPMARL